MPSALPSWPDAEFVIRRHPFRVGVFPSTKPWIPRGPEQRFLGIDIATEGNGDGHPQTGHPLPDLAARQPSGARHAGIALFAGEAAGHTAATFLADAADWTLVIAADAWVAIGPAESAPDAVQIGPVIVDLGRP